MADQQDLKPELKAIYERIMKTNAAPASVKTQPPADQTPTQQTMNTGAPTPPPQPQQAQTQTQQETPVPMEQTPPQSSQQQMTQNSQQAPAVQNENAADSPFSSVPPRSIRDAGNTPFIYSANKKIPFQPPSPAPVPPPQPQSAPPPLQKQPIPQQQQSQQTMSSAQMQMPIQKPKKGNPLMVIFIIVFLVIYTFIWLIVFKVIDLSAFGINLPFSLPF